MVVIATVLEKQQEFNDESRVIEVRNVTYVGSNADNISTQFPTVKMPGSFVGIFLR